MNAESPQQWALAVAKAELKFNEIAATDGNIVAYTREANFALQVIAGSEYLQKCSAESLTNAVVNVASVGLTLSPPEKLAYLVPRKNKACLDISYIGLVKIATDSGSVLAVKAELVRANDQFEYVDAFTMPHHRFDPFGTVASRGEVIGVYVIAKLANGVTQIETLSREEIEKIKAVSKAASGPWVDWFEEMAKKSGIKRASKLWPRTERLSKAIALVDEHQGNVGQIGHTIDHATGEVTVGAARDAYEAAQDRLERLVKDAEAAATPEALQVVWKAGLAEVEAAKDKPAYDALKAVVQRRRETFAAAKEAA